MQWVLLVFKQDNVVVVNGNLFLCGCSKNQEKGEKELVLQEDVSSTVWVCMSTNSSTKVLVLDATQPTELLDSFYACNSHVVCIASVPGRLSVRSPVLFTGGGGAFLYGVLCTFSGVLDTDYPGGDGVSQDSETSQGDGASLAGSVASVGSTGSDGAMATDGVTAVAQTASSGVAEQLVEFSAVSGSGSSLHIVWLVRQDRPPQGPLTSKHTT